MRKLLLIITVFFTFNVAQASLPNIVASVNDEPITLNEFRARKKNDYGTK